MSQSLLLLLTDPAEVQRARAALEAAGLEVEAADPGSWSGPSGERPAAVVLDGSLPDARSFGLCLELRGGEWHDVPVAWVGGPEDELAALAVGASLFLGAPLDEDELVAHARALAAPNGARTSLETGLARFRAREFEEAMSALEEAGEGLLGAWSQYHAGAVRLEHGDQQAAAEELQALLDERPDFWRAHVQLSRLYARAGFDAEAERHLADARTLRPGLGESVLTEVRPLPPISVPVPAGEEVELLVGHEPAPEPEPTAEPAAEPAAEPVPPAVEEDDRPLVLLADDSELALAMIGAFLEEAGYRVVTAENGAEAIERARERRPDLVVLDGLMPGVNGFEACAKIKTELEFDEPPPVVLLSAIYTKQKQRYEAMKEYGADDLVAKSTDHSGLLEAAHRLCPLTKA